jgi:hypothetical protein
VSAKHAPRDVVSASGIVKDRTDAGGIIKIVRWTWDRLAEPFDPAVVTDAAKGKPSYT